MSALVGLFRTQPAPEDDRKVARMLAAVAHRGPDGLRLWHDADAGIGFGFAALHTTDMLRDQQPVHRSESGIVVVADGRVDNRAELLQRLGMSGASTVSDAGLVARAYECWGEDCADRLVGDFAFAVWDPRSQTLVCARDIMGVKPFYYAHSRDLFAFASEAKALLCLPEIARDIDRDAVGGFIALDDRHLDDRSRTMYRAIARLPAAHTLRVDRQGVSLRRYWSLDIGREVRYASNDQYAEEFHHLLTEAVRARLRTGAPRPVGATLSGGLDSSAIVCVARRIGGESVTALHTFSLVFPELPESELRMIDEGTFVDEVVRGGGVAPHFVRGDRVSPLTDLERMLWHLDEPFFAQNLYLHWAMYREAGQQGVRVLLDGFDGDCAIGHGVGRLTNLLRARRWDVFEAEVRAFATNHRSTPDAVLRAYAYPYLSSLAVAGRWDAWWETAGQLSRRFGVSKSAAAVNLGVRPLVRRRAAPVVREREQHVQGLSQPVYQLALEIADKTAAAFGVEPRYPFFDRRLIEFCVALPDSQKFSAGWSRAILRRAMQGILPPAIQWRANKANLAPNFHRAFRGADGTRVAGTSYGALSRYIDTRAVRTARSDYFRRRNHGSGGDAALLFRATTMATWLATFEGHVGAHHEAPRPHRSLHGLGAHAATA